MVLGPEKGTLEVFFESPGWRTFRIVLAVAFFILFIYAIKKRK